MSKGRGRRNDVAAKSLITDNGLEQIKGLDQLQDLSLNGTHITDTALVKINGLKKLQRLNLNNTQVTDAGLEHIKGMMQLEELDLRGGQLENRSDLAHCRVVWVRAGNTKITDAGVKKLQQALPNCKIER